LYRSLNSGPLKVVVKVSTAACWMRGMKFIGLPNFDDFCASFSHSFQSPSSSSSQSPVSPAGGVEFGAHGRSRAR
jgi:hypothetical protein